MKFRISLVGKNNSNNQNDFGFNGTEIPTSGVVMNIDNSNSQISDILGNKLEQSGGIILSPDEIMGIDYNSFDLESGEIDVQNEIGITITGKLLSHIDENDDFDEGSSGKEAMLGGLMSNLGLGTLYNKYNQFKGIQSQVESIFDSGDDTGNSNGEGMKLKGKKDEIFKQSPEFQSNMENVLGKEDKLKSMGFGDLFSSNDETSSDLGSSLLSSSGITANEEKSSNNEFGKIARQVLGVSSAIPLTKKFSNGLGRVLNGMFGSGGENFGLNNLYETNKKNIIALSQWAMTYGESKYTKDVLIQVDLGTGNVFEMFFPKMRVEYFSQNFNILSGEGIFTLTLKQSKYQENEIDLQ